ncbi:GntR family transcriptional regulator [Parapusillimonas sp. JC17]|uniref:GntR family transcriptional regulator n=1 Tax=Parapusillimonas sp. JC17 TaxID=3445768 RepID=UPI003FA00307
MAKVRGKVPRMLGDEIAAEIRNGGFRPGEWIRLGDIEERFQATRFDARRALSELVLRQILEHAPNRGYRVYAPDPETIRHVREARALLESEAIRSVARNIDEENLAALRALANEFRQAADHGTRSEQNDINNQFHQMLYACAGNPVIQGLIEDLRQRLGGSSHTVWQSRDALLQSALDHADIVKALEAHDAELAVRLVQRHINRESE